MGECGALRTAENPPDAWEKGWSRPGRRGRLDPAQRWSSAGKVSGLEGAWGAGRAAEDGDLRTQVRREVMRVGVAGRGWRILPESHFLGGPLVSSGQTGWLHAGHLLVSAPWNPSWGCILSSPSGNLACGWGSGCPWLCCCRGEDYWEHGRHLRLARPQLSLVGILGASCLSLPGARPAGLHSLVATWWKGSHRGGALGMQKRPPTLSVCSSVFSNSVQSRATEAAPGPPGGAPAAWGTGQTGCSSGGCCSQGSPLSTDSSSMTWQPVHPPKCRASPRRLRYEARGFQ